MAAFSNNRRNQRKGAVKIRTKNLKNRRSWYTSHSLNRSATVPKDT